MPKPPRMLAMEATASSRKGRDCFGRLEKVVGKDKDRRKARGVRCEIEGKTKGRSEKNESEVRECCCWDEWCKRGESVKGSLI